MIETARLRLRPWQINDLRHTEAILADPEVMEFSDHGVLTPAQRLEWLNQAVEGSADADLPGRLAIERKADGAILGYVSLQRDLARVGANDAELGFRLAKAAWNQGYATEAAFAAINSVKGSPSVHRIVAIVYPHNHRSIRVVEKLGFVRQGEVMFEGYDIPDHLFALDLWRTADEAENSSARP